MKKYVYSKGEETVTVETDGLAAINNFMVTGLIGQNYGGLVHAGLAFKMGDTVSIPEMLNAAKRCECKVECYEGGTLIIDESADFTGGEPEPKGIIFGLQLGVAYNEATYNSVVQLAKMFCRGWWQSLTNRGETMMNIRLKFGLTMHNFHSKMFRNLLVQLVRTARCLLLKQRSTLCLTSYVT